MAVQCLASSWLKGLVPLGKPIDARAIHDSIRGSIWIRTHGFSKFYNLELDPWENRHTESRIIRPAGSSTCRSTIQPRVTGNHGYLRFAHGFLRRYVFLAVLHVNA